MRRSYSMALFFSLALLFISCSDNRNASDEFQWKQLTRISPYYTYIKDEFGRYVNMYGVNLGGSSRVPVKDDPTINRTETPDFTGRPFPIEDADRHFSIIKALGFNTVRLLFTWEGMEPDERGVYNTEYLNYLEQLISKANDHHIYVVLAAEESLFSRYLMANFNDQPLFGLQGTIAGSIGSIFPYTRKDCDHLCNCRTSLDKSLFTNVLRGNGAPKWAVKACLPEKEIDLNVSGKPNNAWGTFRSLIPGLEITDITALLNLLLQLGFLSDMSEYEMEQITNDIYCSLIESVLGGVLPDDVNYTNDMLPWTYWGMNAALSLDVERCYASLFAGNIAYPTYQVDGENIKDYLQSAYKNMWVEIARMAGTYPNISGYDIINEPNTLFILLSAATVHFNGGSEADVKQYLINMLGQDIGKVIGNTIYALRILPALPTPEEDPSGEKRDLIKKKWGFQYADSGGMFTLNNAFSETYLKPFYELVGKAIQEVDDDAVIWIDEPFSMDMLFGEDKIQIWNQPMTVPEGINQVVFAPHWYPDIQPFPGFNMPPRSFTADEIRYRDYKPDLQKKLNMSAYQFSKIPTVIGSFGVPFNLNGINDAKKSDYLVTGLMLDNIYEGLESLLLSGMLWNYTADNSNFYGDRWNMENFSVLDADGKPRGRWAFSRPHASSTPGIPKSTYFYSDNHYYVPKKGVLSPWHEFFIEMDVKETMAPAEIFLPENQYPDGFYVWISDGYAVSEYQRVIYNSQGDSIGYYTLYYYPGEDVPDAKHVFYVVQPLQGLEVMDWIYFINKDQVVSKK